MNEQDTIFDIAIEKHGEIATIILSGLFVFNTAWQFEEACRDLVKKKPKAIGLCCKNIVMLDSSALGSLALVAKNARKNKVDLYFLDMSDTMRRMVRATRSDKMLGTPPGNAKGPAQSSQYYGKSRR
ncbi:MAG: STAS domain-containing protein [bacterium]|nr:STAS domain-containing protein [bacterium]